MGFINCKPLINKQKVMISIIVFEFFFITVLAGCTSSRNENKSTDPPTQSETSNEITPGTVVTFILDKTPAVTQDKLLLGEKFSYSDESGKRRYVESMDEWFDNASFLEFKVPTGIYNQGIASNGAKLYILKDDTELKAIYKVDGFDDSVFEFTFNKGSRFAVVKTDAGYDLLPKETLAFEDISLPD